MLKGVLVGVAMLLLVGVVAVAVLGFGAAIGGGKHANVGYTMAVIGALDLAIAIVAAVFYASMLRRFGVSVAGRVVLMLAFVATEIAGSAGLGVVTLVAFDR